MLSLKWPEVLFHETTYSSRVIVNCRKRVRIGALRFRSNRAGDASESSSLQVHSRCCRRPVSEAESKNKERIRKNAPGYRAGTEAPEHKGRQAGPVQYVAER